MRMAKNGAQKAAIFPTFQPKRSSTVAIFWKIKSNIRHYYWHFLTNFRICILSSTKRTLHYNHPVNCVNIRNEKEVPIKLFVLLSLEFQYSMVSSTPAMDISEIPAHEDTAFVYIDTRSRSGKDSYNSFIRQQQSQRERDRRKRLRSGCIDQRKRINEHMILGNNSFAIAQLHESIIHHDPNASTSNKTIHNISNFELERTLNGLNVSSTAYVLSTPIYCKHCNARKFYRICCADGKIKLLMPDLPSELYNLFTSKELSCIEFKKIVRGYNNHFAFTSFGVKYDKNLFKAYKGIYTFRVQGQVHH
ncbi:uncharacterized protein LOC111392925 [Olea europaea var. sylvestris]|uniref:uncharacterized protein LOC111392925 n=1 Tax=Olea europaea var. sylvestris TaxID=158386 RepID=UPI000C1CF631|nr:uncharacterized protein LOC111392925 [Olea europaea var. sylvestris]